MRITKKIATIILFVGLGVCSINAQQTPSFAQYNYNPFILNSAYAGLTPSPELTVSNEGYFNSIEGSPRSFALSGHGAINNNKVGIGAGIIRDQIGVTTSTTFFAAYSYKIFFDFNSNRPYWQLYDAGVLSFGLTAGVQQYKDNLSELGIINDFSFAKDINVNIPTMGVSILFNHSNFYIGLSTPNILGDALVTDKSLDVKSPYYGYFGYRFYNNRFKDLMIKPSLLLKHEEGAALQTDINLSVSFRNKFELGTGYRSSNAINLLAGIYLFDSVRFIYNYNIATNGSPLGNTHSFVLSFRFGEGYKII